MQFSWRSYDATGGWSETYSGISLGHLSDSIFKKWAQSDGPKILLAAHLFWDSGEHQKKLWKQIWDFFKKKIQCQHRTILLIYLFYKLRVHTPDSYVRRLNITSFACVGRILKKYTCSLEEVTFFFLGNTSYVCYTLALQSYIEIAMGWLIFQVSFQKLATDHWALLRKISAMISHFISLHHPVPCVAKEKHTICVQSHIQHYKVYLSEGCW